jgi:hypothetical protein
MFQDGQAKLTRAVRARKSLGRSQSTQQAAQVYGKSQRMARMLRVAPIIEATLGQFGIRICAAPNIIRSPDGGVSLMDGTLSAEIRRVASPRGCVRTS